MPHEVLINVGAAEVRVAVVEDGKLQLLSATRTLGCDDGASRNGRSLVGDIVLGRVVRVLPAVQAAFVEIGLDRAGFLGAREARCLEPDAVRELAISELLREGDEVLVQIVKDPMGEKGARLSASVTVPGRLCVLTPYQSGIALSRRIEDEAERARLQSIGETIAAGDGLIAGAGYIFRTAAVGATAEELLADARQLAGEWRAIEAASADAAPPTTLHHDLDPVERALRDVVHDDTARILIDDREAVETARAYCRQVMPAVEDRILHFTGPGALFDDFETDIDGLANPRVALACGGWITIEGTEALTAIDVNSGRFTHASGLEDMGLAVNLEAAREIGRQVRLRGIGGLIVVDFIHMREPEHVERVLESLSSSLGRDGVPVTIAPMTQLGLVEITRKRVREPLVSRWNEVCAACGGDGVTRRADVIAMDVLRRVEASAAAAPGKPIDVRAAPVIVRWLEEQGEALHAALARKGAANVRFVADETCARERFDVGTLP
jgi:ribonuclease G